MGTSSANPDKLSTYSTNGLQLVDELRPKANAVNDAIAALSASRSPHLPALGDAHTRFTDLVDDWFHLDEFAGDVAEGFRRANSGATNGVVTMSDADLRRLGQVGFADRDQAIAAAQNASQQLDDLLHRPVDELSPQDLEALFALIERGQYDPAFAVTLSETIGVAGYVDAMTLIQNVCDTTEGEYRVTNQGLGYAALLGTTLTTALDTVYQSDGYRDPNNANLPADQRLDYGFVDDLTQGYHGRDYGSSGPYQGDPDDLIYVRAMTPPWEFDRNLSVLLSYTDPPTWVAVDIANHRLSPLLEDYVADTGTGPNALVWGDRSGTVTNYASMLSRNPDASTHWLYQEAQGVEHDNLELVLERVTGTDMDGGAALARVVENGLTNNDVHEPIPGAPSYVEGGLMRETLMERVIDITAAQGEIRNGHLHGAFAAGVDANMSVIDERINAPFRFDEGERPAGVLDEFRNTHDFLRETMGNADAAREIDQSIFEYGMEEAGDLPADPEEREARLRQLGRIQGMATEAEENAGVGAVLDEMLENDTLGPTPGSGTNFVLGYVPGLNSVNNVAQAMGISVGDGVNWVAEELLGEDYDHLSQEQQEARVQRARDRLNGAIWTATGLYDDNTPQGAELRATAQGQPFVNPDGSIKTVMTPEEQQAFREWAWDAVGNDNDQGPVYTEHGDITAGTGEVRAGETDVNDRR